MKLFCVGDNRFDNKVKCLAGTEHKALLKDVCTNSATGHVVDHGTYVVVPAHAVEAIAEHLQKRGWQSATRAQFRAAKAEGK